MNKIFIDSIKLLLPLVNLSKPISDPQTILEFKKHANTLNSLFHRNNPFLSEIDFNNDTLPLPPTILTSPKQEGKFKYLLFSLNPSMKEKLNCKELNRALNQNPSQWKQYVDYYTKGITGIYQEVIPESPYYRNRITFLKALERCKYEKWSVISGNKKEDKKIFGVDFMNKPGVIVADIIPFHSTSTPNISITDLYSTLPEYQNYHKYLFNTLIKKLEKEGTIIVDGKLTSKVFLDIINTLGGLTHIQKFDCAGKPVSTTGKTVKLTTACFSGKKVIIFHEFLQRQGGCFNSALQLEKIIKLLCGLNISC